MFEPPSADENASKAERDAGEDEEDEGARSNEDKVVKFQLEQSRGRLLVRFLTCLQFYFMSSIQHFDTRPPHSIPIQEIITMLKQVSLYIKFMQTIHLKISPPY